MGYRIHLGSISNKRLRELKKVTSSKELFKVVYPDKEYDSKNDYVGVYDMCSEKNIHEFGKYIEWTEELQKKYSKPIFSNKEFNKTITKENDFFIINKEGLKYIIEDLANDTKSYYSTMWALSTFLDILITRDTDATEKWANACNIIYSKDDSYNAHKWALDLDHDLAEIFSGKEVYEKIIKQSIDYLSSQLNSYFKSELHEYQTEHKHVAFYNLDEKKPLCITNSWRKDKAIMELAHIYKTFNFRSNKLVVYGY